jgi:S-adenosylmethionine:tRNA ribosyltransferase-isomerase
MSAAIHYEADRPPLDNPLSFELTDDHIARRPPERRGLARDEVRLLVTGASTGANDHAQLRDLPEFLRPGDLLVLNDSQTLKAAIECTREDGSSALLHLSTRLDGRYWSGELRARSDHGTRPLLDGVAGERLLLPQGTEAVLEAGYQRPHGAGEQRLWRVRVDLCGSVLEFLEAHGEPIRYAYIGGRWPIDDYRTPFGTRPGSAEMPSAGRGFTTELLARLALNGVQLATVTLHTGVSSLEAGEPPYPEWFEVPAMTAALVESTRRRGGRTIAVGTTVVRALESAANSGGLRATCGWTDLVITPERPLEVVDGLITGLHEPKSSHLSMLSSFIAPERLSRAYAEAVAEGYLWHEFGDVQLIVGA